MKSTALGAENIIFISDAHEKFYYEKLQEVRYQDVYHKALCFCLGINGDTRKNADRIYNFKTGSVKTKCLHEGWQTSGSQSFFVGDDFHIHGSGNRERELLLLVVEDFRRWKVQLTHDIVNREVGDIRRLIFTLNL